MMKKKRRLVAIATVLGLIAVLSWLTPYDYSNCPAVPTLGFNCLFRNSGLTVVRVLSLSLFVLVVIRAAQKTE